MKGRINNRLADLKVASFRSWQNDTHQANITCISLKDINKFLTQDNDITNTNFFWKDNKEEESNYSHVPLKWLDEICKPKYEGPEN